MKKFFIIMMVIFLITDAEAQRRAPSRGVKKPGYKDPRTAALLSIIPGAGHFYLGDITGGVMFAGGGLVSFICLFYSFSYEDIKMVTDTETVFPEFRSVKHTLRPLTAIGIIGLLTIWGGGSFHAYNLAKEINKAQSKLRRYGMEYQLNKDNIMISLSYKF